MSEEIKIGAETEKPKGHIRGIWGILIVIIVALLVLGGIGYYFYKTDPSQFAGLFDWKKAPKLSPSPTSTATPSLSATPSGSCTPAALSTEEQAIISGWETHTNTAGKFEFKYPASWTATAEYVDMVRMQDSEDANVKFKFGRAEAGTVNVSGWGTPNESAVQVYCIDATKKVYEKGSGSPYDYLVVVSFERYGTPNILTYEFKAIGASIASDYIDQFDALVKTFRFLP